MNWMPIESAPKDGTRVLAYGTISTWWNGKLLHRNGCQFTTWIYGNWVPGPPTAFGNGFVPTHWIQIPEPPQ